MSVPTEHLLGLAAILFAIGMAGFLTRRNLIVVLMSIELMLNAANLTLVAGARMHSKVDELSLAGPILAIFVIAVAAVEAAVGLALVIALYRRKQTVSLDAVSELRD
ncbi:MAG: NADH-quinone oxidoreductase subunit NuoK [Planctomycetota bacterium]|nr:NADH-quinone oxidoreductase subunit NuoK [Planctomycetota bacterium]